MKRQPELSATYEDESSSRNAAVYIRWSTDDQGDGTTKEVQLEACRNFILSQGWAFREDLVFIDDGYTGFNLDRPALEQLRRLVLEGAVDCVVVYKLDRLSRNLADAVYLVRDEWADICQVRSVTETFDTTTDIGTAFFGVLATFAEIERSSIADRMLSGLATAVQNGETYPNQRPYGYRADRSAPAKTAPDPEEAPTLRRIFEAARDGVSLTRLATQLNREGVPSPRGKHWTHCTIQRIIRNPVYKGYIVWRRSSARRLLPKHQLVDPTEPQLLPSRIDDPRRWEFAENDDAVIVHVPGLAIIPEELWEAANRALDAVHERTRHWQSRKDRKAAAAAEDPSPPRRPPHLLTGLVQCRCGAALVYVNYRFLVCRQARVGACTYTRSIPKEVAEPMVEQAFLSAYGTAVDRAERLDAARRPLMERISDLTAQRRALSAKLARIQERQAALLDEILDQNLPLNKVDELSAGLDRQVREIQQQIVAVDREIRAQNDRLRATDRFGEEMERADHWDRLSTEEKRYLLRLALAKRITIVRTDPRGSREPAIEMEITWKTD